MKDSYFWTVLRCLLIEFRAVVAPRNEYATVGDYFVSKYPDRHIRSTNLRWLEGYSWYFYVEYRFGDITTIPAPYAVIQVDVGAKDVIEMDLNQHPRLRLLPRK